MPSKAPPNYGRIIIDDGDLDAARFWIRVFALEPYVAVATADIVAQKEVKKASVPIISEYQAGQLYFYYAIILFIDPLGLSGVAGGIWFGDAEHRAEAEEKRNELGDHVMQSLKERMDKGDMTGHMLTIPPGKESDQC